MKKTILLFSVKSLNYYLCSSLLLMLLFIGIGQVGAQTFPSSFAGVQLATGLDPVSLDIAPDGRIFFTEKNGKIRIIKDGVLLPTAFASIVVDNSNERGLQGIVLDPNFATNNYIYVHYTATSPNPHNRVSRFTANGDVVSAGSEFVVIELDPLSSAGVHNGGSLLFKDGKIFISTGENGDANLAQAFNNLKGKILRLNSDGTIPTDNPFFTSLSDKYRAIYALGFRNPFKTSIQAGTGKIYVNDVGGGSFEEINELTPGKNYGWPIIEGMKTSQTPPANYQDPLHAYDHGQGCSITAGSFYNPSSVQFPPTFLGKYFFTDYCSGWVRTYDPATGTVSTFATGLDRPLDIRFGSDGTMYYIARGGIGGGSVEDNTSSNEGVLWKVTYTGSGAPIIAVEPNDKTATINGSATFQVFASGNPAPTYQWKKNGVNIPGANASSYTISNVSLTDDGSKFQVVISNTVSTVTSREATLSVTSNQKPVANIVLPSDGATYTAGDVISFSGTGIDPEEGTLPGSAFTWKVNLLHYDTPQHFHPVVEPTTGITSGSFIIPTSGETSASVLFRIYLTVQDASGLKNTDSLDVNPNKSLIKLTANFEGLKVKLDGTEYTSPYNFTGVSGIERTIAVDPTQIINGSTFTFVSWSDNGSASHTISTPSSNTTYVANYIRNADNPSNLVNGIEYAYYEGSFDVLPDFNILTPIKTGVGINFDLSSRNRNDDFAYKFLGYIDVLTDGEYTFYTNSDDGSKLYIGNSLVVNNDGLHGTEEKSGKVMLKTGKHSLTTTFFEKDGDEVLAVSYEGPGISKQLVPAFSLYRVNNVIPPTTVTSTIYEAEDAILSGVKTSTIHAGYTGTSFGDYINATQDYIEWDVNAPVAGIYTLAFRYALGSAVSRPLEIKVNGAINSASLDFPVTNTWTNWVYVSTSANLNAGLNKVRATATIRSGANVDHLKVTYSNTSGARKSAANSALLVYPVPATAALNVNFSSGVEETANVELVNSVGVKSLIIPMPIVKGDNYFSISLSDVPAGIYLLRIITNEGVFIQRVEKE